MLLSLQDFPLSACRKWKLVSHSLNVNPFPASFVNWRCTLRLHVVTREEVTVMTWRGELETEPQVRYTANLAHLALLLSKSSSFGPAILQLMNFRIWKFLGNL